MTIQICHILISLSLYSYPYKKLKKPYYGTTNLRKRAKTRVRVVIDIQSFALRVQCVHGIPKLA